MPPTAPERQVPSCPKQHKSPDKAEHKSRPRHQHARNYQQDAGHRQQTGQHERTARRTGNRLLTRSQRVELPLQVLVVLPRPLVFPQATPCRAQRGSLLLQTRRVQWRRVLRYPPPGFAFRRLRFFQEPLLLFQALLRPPQVLPPLGLGFPAGIHLLPEGHRSVEALQSFLVPVQTEVPEASPQFALQRLQFRPPFRKVLDGIIEALPGAPDDFDVGPVEQQVLPRDISRSRFL